MASELAVAYVSLVADTSKIPSQIESSLKQGARGADSVGRSMGSKIASAMGSTLKAGAIAAGTVAGLALSTALTQGMKRLVAIDDAKGKLAGLGHSAESVAEIMSSALASVKGTAFGLGEAATIAASAVAAGIQPGQELTKYLKLTADAATIAGTSLEEMGSIVNKVQASGKVFTDNLNQLSDRGVPIFQWLQKEYGVSADELSKMVKAGEVDSETFKRVIEKNIGGAALESGKTLRGSFANMKAAFGRLGEGFLTPFLNDGKGGLGKVTELLDRITPSVSAFAQRTADGLHQMSAAFKSSGDSIDGEGTRWERFGERARKVTDGIRGVFSILASGDFKGADMTFGLEEDSKVVDILFRIREGAQRLFDVIKSPSAEGFSKFFDVFKSSGTEVADGLNSVGGASDSVGESIGKLGSVIQGAGTSLLDLVGSTGSVAVVGLRALGNIMGFFADHTTAATVALAGLAAGYAIAQTAETAFHIARVVAVIQAPAILAGQLLLTRALTAHTIALRENMAAQGFAVSVERQSIAQRIAGTATRIRDAAAINAQTTALARYAAVQRAAVASSGAFVGALRNGAANIATLGANAQGAGRAGLSAMRTGASNLASALGGPLVLGLAAAVIGIISFKSASDTLNKNIEANRTSAERFGESMQTFRQSLDEAFGDSGGTIDRGVKSVVTDQLAAIDDELEAASERFPSKWQGVVSFFKESFSFGQGNQIGDALELTDAANQARAAQSALESLDMTTKDLGAAAVGSSSQWDDLRNSLLATGDGGRVLVDKYDEVRRVFLESQSSANKVRDAFLEIKDGAVGASAGVSGLASALGLLRDDESSVEDAQQKVNDSLRSFKEALNSGGAATIDAAGKIDTATAAGSQLRDTTKGVQQAFDEAAAAAITAAQQQGQSSQQVAAAGVDAGQRVRDSFIELATAALGSKEAAVALADQLKLFPAEIPTKINLDTQTPKNDMQELLQVLSGKSVTVPVHPVLQDNPDLGSQISPQVGTIFGIPPRPRADGGIDNLPGQATIQPGRGGGLVQWAEGETGGEAFIPMSAAKRGRSTSILAEVASRFGFSLQKYADGGIRAALSAGRSVDGNPYSWGGTGPTNFDCSGFVGWLQQIAMGIVGSTKRLYTTLSLIGGATAGLVSGLGPVGTFFQVGVSDEHMAATIDGHNAESGGAHGTSGIDGGRAGARDSQFPYKFHLPNEQISNLVLGTGSGKQRVQWSDDDETDLKSAEVAVTQAEEARDKVYGDDSKSEADKQQADLKVEKAQNKVVELQGKKDDAASGVGIAPEAPELTRRYTDDEAARIDAEAAVEAAKLRRNDVYADPEATETDRLKADVELSKALDGLTRPTGESEEKGVKGVLRDLITDSAGILFDAALEQLPFDLGQSRWWSIDYSAFTQKPKEAIGSVPSFTQNDVMSQLGFDPATGIPAWFEQLRKGAPAKLFDQGGVMNPGDIGINLLKKPEAWLTPLEKENVERIANLDMLRLPPSTPQGPTGPRVQIDNHIKVSDERSQMRKLKTQNQLVFMQYGGGL
ncbi:tape measure protein [Antrihabitans sp. YC3-6]|uniref:Tape measure protein n=1 Tax=Antrihabitans stalagmiti TaxID=2799499 RepID=A0A934NWB2_9NOCA|nr:tape measure protein [Antrihabitans stalagmiti]MBJ8342774.1 tape measure protein [Antrihabitans stalagmiti]